MNCNYVKKVVEPFLDLSLVSKILLLLIFIIQIIFNYLLYYRILANLKKMILDKTIICH